jgi:hypothetical protein
MKTMRLSRNARLDIVAARAWSRVVRRADQTRASRVWARMDVLTVQALRLYLRLIRDNGELAELTLWPPA